MVPDPTDMFRIEAVIFRNMSPSVRSDPTLLITNFIFFSFFFFLFHSKDLTVI